MRSCRALTRAGVNWSHHQPPQPVVLRRVEEEERARLDALRADEGNLGLALVLAHARVVQQGGDIGVAC